MSVTSKAVEYPMDKHFSFSNYGIGFSKFGIQLVLIGILSTCAVQTLSAQSCPTSNTLFINVVPDPVVEFVSTSTSVCTGGSALLETAFQYGAGDCQLQWHYSENGIVWQVIPGATQPTYNTGPLTATRYYRTTIFCDGIGCNTDTSSVITVTVLPTPSSTISGPSGVCSGQPVNLTVTATGGLGGFTYQWQQLTPQGMFENIVGATSTHLSVPSVLTTTTYKVVVVGQGSACQTQTEKTIVAYERPQAWLTHDGPACIGKPVTLQAGSGETYSWQGPNNFVGSGNTVTFSNVNPAQAGVYTVTVTSSAGCTATASNTLIVSNCSEICDNGFDDDNDGLVDCVDLDCAVGDFDIVPLGPTQVCAPQQVQLTVPSLYPVVWSNGSTQTLITVTSSGVYSVTATNSNGCTRSASVEVVVYPAVNLTATLNSTSVCEGTFLSGVASGADLIVWRGPAGYVWFGSVFRIDNISTQYNGTFTVTGFGPGGCSAQLTFQVEVLPAPQAVVAHGGVMNCNSSSVGLQGWSSTTGVTYLWTSPDGSTINQQNPVVSTEGIYTLRVTNSVNGCYSTDTALVMRDQYQMPITVTALGIITCAEPSAFVKVVGEHDNVTVNWTGVNGFTATGRLVEVPNAGTYTAHVTNLTNGCVTTATVVVEGNLQKPVVWANPGVLSCESPLTQLQAGSNIMPAQYFWSGPNGFHSNLQNPLVGHVGIYEVYVKNPTNGCESDRQQVQVISQ